jgi:hypothetical protein
LELIELKNYETGDCNWFDFGPAKVFHNWRKSRAPDAVNRCANKRKTRKFMPVLNMIMAHFVLILRAMNVSRISLKTLAALVTLLFSFSTLAQPNLTPYQPSGWSDKIVVSTVTSTSTDAGTLLPTDTLYVDWAVKNIGTTSAGSFTVGLYVDNVLKSQWGSGSVPANAYTYVTDYSLGSLSAGTHTIQIVADTGNTVAESNESDNTYTKTITIGTINVPAPTLIAPANAASALSTTPSFTWTSASNATSYRIMVATSAADLPTDPNASTGGPSMVINTISATTNYTPVMPVNPGLTYYWQVHGRAGTDNGTWSTVNSFSTAAGPATGLTIVPVWDSTITSDPNSAEIQSTINAAIAVYKSKFSDPVTVSINFQEMGGGLGQSSSYYQTRTYSSYRSALASHATSADDTTALANLPATSANPVNSNSSIDVNLPLLRALGFSANPPAGQSDGTIYLNTSLMNLSGAETDSSKYALFSVVSHEIDEVLGFSSALNNLSNGDPTPTGPISPNDLFRYDQFGARNFTTDVNAAAYFSLDGTTQLARYNQTQGGDFQDWYSPGGQTPQVQDAIGTHGSTPVLGVELRMLDVIGWTPVAAQSTITASAGSGGTISPSGAILKSAGTSQLFTATPNSGNIVNQWLLDGASVQTGGTTYTLSNIQTNHTVQVTFTATLNQTITFGALANKIYGAAPFTVSATASSGLAVSFSILAGPATISGSTVTITGAGTVTVRASQAGNGTYNAAPNVDQSFTVSPASQTITFGALANKNYGDPAFTVSATASSGLAVSFSILSGPATISGNTVTITGAGTVTVRASQAGNANYSAAPNVDQSFTVAKLNQTITFGSLPNRTLGEPAFAVSGTASSGLAVAFSILSGPATISTGTVTLTNTGTVIVRASQAGNGNYNAAANVDQSFTVYTPPQLTLTRSSTNVLISWPTNVAGFTLLSATNLNPVTAWTPVVPLPVVTNGQNVVTHPTSTPAKFYRLKK